MQVIWMQGSQIQNPRLSGRPACLRESVVVSRLQYDDVVIGHVVDEPVLLVDTTRPGARKNVSEWFGLSDAVEWIANDIRDQQVDPPQRPAVLCLPVDVVLPPVRVEGK